MSDEVVEEFIEFLDLKADQEEPMTTASLDATTACSARTAGRPRRRGLANADWYRVPVERKRTQGS